jgi:hypothetical protein
VTLAIEELGRRKHAGDQQRGVDARELALPGTPARVHVEEVIVEALVAGRAGRLSLLARGEEPQHRERQLRRHFAADELAPHAHRVGGERHAHGCDAGGPVLAGLVEDQAVGAVDLVHEVAEGVALQAQQHPRVTGREAHRVASVCALFKQDAGRARR